MTSTPHAATQRFDGKVAVVPGGASGIGLATTRRSVAEGGRVVVAAEDDVRSLVATAEERFGGARTGRSPDLLRAFGS